MVEREYLNLKLNCEDVAEFSYRPGKCSKDYRMVVLRQPALRSGERHRRIEERRQRATNALV